MVLSMSYVAFGDESGIQRRRSPTYTIGCFVVPVERLDDLSSGLQSILDHYGHDDEMKWTKVGSHRARSDATYDGVRMLLESGITFDAIVVEKSTYHKWSRDREEAFYTTYYQLAEHIVQGTGEPVELRIDQRHDRYAKRAEVLGIVTNHAIANISASGHVTNVSMVESKSSRILQFTDVLVGAVNSDTSSALSADVQVNRGKNELIGRIAALVGWPRLCFDTMPNSVFNVWHFPPEFRARPETRRVQPSRQLGV